MKVDPITDCGSRSLGFGLHAGGAALIYLHSTTYSSRVDFHAVLHRLSLKIMAPSGLCLSALLGLSIRMAGWPPMPSSG